MKRNTSDGTRVASRRTFAEGIRAVPCHASCRLERSRRRRNRATGYRVGSSDHKIDVVRHGRGLPDHAGRIRVVFTDRGRLPGVDGQVALPQRVRVTALWVSGLMTDQPGFVALPGLLRADIGHSGYDLPRLAKAARGVVPSDLAHHEPEVRHQCLGAQSSAQPGLL